MLTRMKATLNIDDALLARASELTGVTVNASLVRMALEVLIAHHSAARLAMLGGSEQHLKAARRR